MRASIVTIFGVGILVGCSSPQPGGSTGGAAGTSPSVAGMPAGGAAGAAQSDGGTGEVHSGGGAGQPAAGGAATTATHVGQVLLQSRVRGGSTVTVSARFTSSPAPTTECTTVKDGPCSVSSCTSTETVSLPTYASAGTVTVTSPEVMGTATLTPDADGSYPTPSEMFFQKVFDGEEHLQFKASGDVVPAFDGEVDVPLVLLISQPSFTAGQTSVDVPRSQDLSLSWTRGVEGVFLYFVASSERPDGQPGSAGIYCQFPGEPGTAVVKASHLQQMKPGSQASLFTVGGKVVTAGDYKVSLGVTMPTANPDKAILPNLTLK